ncbi:MAG: DUF3078 domain-containing protein [Bacteroidia bacterium]
MRNTIILFFAFICGGALAQDTKIISSGLLTDSDAMKKEKEDSLKLWKKGGLISLVGQQVSLTNWAAGGQNSISAAALVSLFTGYRKGKIYWNNNLDLGYGVVKQGDNKDWWKNDDRIQFTSKFGRKAFDHSYYSALLDFKSQFAPGYNYPNDSTKISDFLAPAYALAAVGLDYKPNDDFSVFVAPLTCKVTIVANDSLAKYGAYGVQKEVRDPNGTITTHYLKHREEFGGYLKFQYKRNVMENVSFSTMLELFANYLVKPGNIDVNWTTLTTMKVNKYISATLSTNLIYDDDVTITADKNNDGKADFSGPRVQFKQVFGVGLSYKF